MRFSLHRSSRLVLSALTLTAFASFSPAARAQTVLSGSYNNHTVNGYDTISGQSYIVNPTATFNNNGLDGLSVNYSSNNVTVNGGQFDNNSDYGLLVDGGTTTFNGGTINGNFHNLSVQGNGILNIYGGSVTNAQHDGLIAEDGTVNIYGGTISGSGAIDLLAEGVGGGSSTNILSTITLYGTFSQYGLVTGTSGTITGSLVNGGGLQTFTYSQSPNQGGEIFLVHATAPVPEASSFATLGSGLLLLGGLTLFARRRSRAA